ncbi:MAG: HDIG domain-containing protein [Tannerella sp.]|jgi:putative nucleotidyltransferase with HDIG domain|nr:HDIG domain-containing protein [Tannerella sp.]
MKLKKSTIRAVVYFSLTALLIAYFFPREVKFRYLFYEGKPWRYDLLTASDDFPIYKTDEEVKAEKDSIRRRFEPYFRMDTKVKTEQIEKLRLDHAAGPGDGRTRSYLRYIENQLNRLYDSGILPVLEYERLKRENLGQVYVVKDNMAGLRSTAGFHTAKSAAERILSERPESLDEIVLASFHAGDYLTENLTEDREWSEKMLGEQLKKVSLSSGMVQAGERIVGPGEVVDHETYNVLRSFKTVYESKAAGNRWLLWVGQLVLIFGILLCCGLYMATFCPEIFFRRGNLLFTLLCMTACCLLSEIFVKHERFDLYILPFAILPIVVRTFFNSHTALFTHLITVLLCSLLAPFPHEFLLLQILAGVVVIFSLKELTQRSQLVRCSVYVFVAYALGYLSLSLYQEGDLGKIQWIMFLYFGINLVLLLFSYTLIYIVEKAFGYTSPITLIELSNINTPVLKKLSETCPGTFQHSLQVSILASAAGSEIGADTQLIRTGALYHDIGKMAHPALFTENQKGGINPHQDLPFEKSAQLIIHHVTEGVKMAEKASLPKAVIDFIRTHHGMGKTKYFYHSFRNAFPDTPVDEKLFTYPGPNPFSKETALLMMADSVEAASRSLNEYTEERLRTLVDKLIDSQLADGLLKNAPLTFREIERVKKTFVDKLKTMYHTRISYPDLAVKDANIQ